MNAYQYKIMDAFLLAIRDFTWTIGNWIFISFGVITATQLALWIGIASASIQFLFTSYKFMKVLITDFKTGKKKIPFRKRK